MKKVEPNRKSRKARYGYTVFLLKAMNTSERMKKSIATMTKFFKGKGAAEDVPITTDIADTATYR
jgi:hypothetical protein